MSHSLYPYVLWYSVARNSLSKNKRGFKKTDTERSSGSQGENGEVYFTRDADWDQNIVNGGKDVPTLWGPVSFSVQFYTGFFLFSLTVFHLLPTSFLRLIACDPNAAIPWKVFCSPWSQLMTQYPCVPMPYSQGGESHWSSQAPNITFWDE